MQVQFCGLNAPGCAVEKELQFTHVVSLIAPTELEYFPVVHGVQSVAPSVEE
jgi:hypothetical protein